MKIFKVQKTTALICVLFLATLGLTSCLKDNNHYIAPTPTAYLMVIQASPDAPAESLFLTPNQVNQTSFNYGNYLGYFNAISGSRDVQLVSYGTSTVIASDSIHLSANYAYSLFLANTYVKPDFILLTDTIAPPVAGKATIRFVNASAGSANVDLVANSTTLVSNLAYKGASGFTPLSGDSQFTFQVRATGTTTVLASLDSINVRNGNVYTIWYHGSTTGTNPKLSADIITNASY